ncbi:nucleotidyltransferase domain-containing protein [Paenibacillus chondroitinus]|uniref:Nucleotidyltransferase domain-containing protein n=1 Tax=Paenibacillus chondroitinus TaxID=59842 RepID=A0ABU6DLC7_9BACL|nr:MULTISPECIES: nucleotidyltransferase domain-containing protein [Paenibacillus]MCY9657176.1 nucleotidyltransferase domain-containing protein [Paenibacillus anseongense]MEB4798459.1 nucleotidyltransferase domain-containing protein [Paenibacillus chondroitinus]
MSDEYVIKIANKYHIRSEIDATTQKYVINPLEQLISKWAGECLNDIYLSGSRAKGTAINLSSDLDLFISLKSTTDNTLKEIYESLYGYIDRAGYKPRKQNVSIGVNVAGKQVDLVPAKKRPGNTNYHSLYISKRDTWTQTNVIEHINTVKNSDRITEIVLLKIWRKLHKLDYPSIYLELTVIEALKGKSKSAPANNFLILLDYLQNEFVDKKVVDPANTSNVISDDLYKYEKEAIQKKARESRSQKYWEDIIW